MPIDTESKQHWTLRQRLRALIGVSIAMIVILVVVGALNFREFSQQRLEIQQSTEVVQANLQKNFENTRMIGDIHTTLRIYIQSPEKNILRRIQTNVDTLSRSLPDEVKSSLGAFLEKLEILEARMGSLRQNSLSISQAEQSIMAISRELLSAVDAQYFLEIQAINSNACLRHHQLYVDSILTGQTDVLHRTQQEVNAVFEDVDMKLTALAEKLPEVHFEKIQELKNAYYELDEAMATISAIRITTLETQNEISDQLNIIKTEITQNSLVQNKSGFQLMEKVLLLVKNSIILISIILIVAAILFCFTAVFLRQSMIKPLVEFVSLMQKLTKVLAGLHKQCADEDEHYKMLTSISQKRKDEIGQVAKAIYNLLLRLREMATFRQTIEADETPDEIYSRMARIFSEKLGLDRFVIYEKPSDKDTMLPVYCRPFELQNELPEFTSSDKCRAKRTGMTITSFEDPSLCAMFPFRDSMDHVCIPMLVGGRVIGVVQFLFSLYSSEEEREKNSIALHEARHYIAEALPVLQSKHLASKLEEMATEDQLTGLYNRRFLENSLEQIVAGINRRESQIGILMCDMDYFKEVNDNHGHDAGDAVLTQLAKILINTVRQSDMVVRFGGEEFLILLMDCEQDKPAEMAERIRAAVEKYKFQIHGQIIKKTISVGVAEFPSFESKGIWECIKHADVALYKAKDSGRNKVVVFDKEMWEKSSY